MMIAAVFATKSLKQALGAATSVCTRGLDAISKLK
jgi:hypothetical protein